jgi:hypothetical protein
LTTGAKPSPRTLISSTGEDEHSADATYVDDEEVDAEDDADPSHYDFVLTHGTPAPIRRRHAHLVKSSRSNSIDQLIAAAAVTSESQAPAKSTFSPTGMPSTHSEPSSSYTASTSSDIDLKK